MAPSTAHDFLRRIHYGGLDAFGHVRRRSLLRVAKRTGTMPGAERVLQGCRSPFPPFPILTHQDQPA